MARDPAHLDGRILHPGLLSGIRNASALWEVDPRAGSLWNIVHFSEQRHEHRGLPRACRTDYQVDSPTFEHYVFVDMQAELRCSVLDLVCVIRPGKVGLAEADIFCMCRSRRQDIVLLIVICVEEFGLEGCEKSQNKVKKASYIPEEVCDSSKGHLS